jgi:hypothetical protein
MNNLNETIKLLKQQRASVRMTYLVLTGTMVVAILFIILLLISYFLIENSYVLARIFAGLVALLYLVCAAVFARKGLIKLAAWMLIGLYTALGIFILATWGLNAPVGILVLGFAILLSSVMLDSRSIIFVSIIISIGLVLIQLLNINNVITPDTSRLDQQSTPGDAATYVIIFSIFALISWLSKRKMEETLLRARAAERALKLERDQLTERIKKQMTALQRAQQNELKQLYKFAELGQLTTIILHELANYLSVLTLDIDNLEDRHENSIAISRAKESIFYIDTIIDQVRNQIKESDETVNFD